MVQPHEHQWYCAVREEASSKTTSTKYTKQYCNQCPAESGTLSPEADDTRVRDIICCLPGTGRECASDQVADSYNCNGTPKPSEDCADINLFAKGENSRSHRQQDPENWEDLSDSSLSGYIIAVIAVILGLIKFSPNIERFFCRLCRDTVYPTDRYNTRGRDEIRHGGLNPTVPGSHRDTQRFRHRDSRLRSGNQRQVNNGLFNLE